MKLRIIKEFWRNERTGEVKHTFYIEHYVRSFFGPYRWRKFKRAVYAWGDMYTEEVSFDTEEEAIEFVEKMMCPVPESQVVCCAISFQE